METNGGWWLAPIQAPSQPAPVEAPTNPAAQTEPAQSWPPLGSEVDPSRTGSKTRRRSPTMKGRLGALLATIVAFLAKFKSLLLLLPKLKLLTTVGTMAVSVAAYSFVFGWTFAVGFVILLLVHEMGHVIQLRREGIKASAPMFIPFLGAVISAKSLGRNALAEARVGLAGPILGSLGSAACILIWHATGDEIWRALAFTGFFLNLFNLLPVVPLDGGRGDGGDGAVDVVCRVCRDGAARAAAAEPDHLPDPAVRGIRDLQALEAAAPRRKSAGRLLPG